MFRENKPSGGLIYAAILCNPLWLAGFGAAVYFLTQALGWGSTGRSGGWFIVSGGLCALWILVWTVLFACLHRRVIGRAKRRGVWRAALALELAALLAMAGAGGVEIARCAGEKETWLGRYLDRLEHTTHIALERDNLYSDGAELLLEELEEKLELTGPLYVSSAVSLRFDRTGAVTALEAGLCGQNAQGECKNYLLAYSAASRRVTAWETGASSACGEEERRLEPLAELLEKLDLAAAVEGWQAEEFALLYYGSRTFEAGSENLIWVDESGEQTETQRASTGYEVSLFLPGYSSATGELAPKRYFCGWEPGEIGPEEERAAGVSVMDENGDPMFFLNQEEGWRLTVSDAAAGSRFYVLHHTSDGGRSWQLLNEDPFQGSVGANAGLYFSDAQLGFLLLPSADDGYSRLYRTEDGGLTFARVSLPVAGAYDHPALPSETDGVFYLTVGGGVDGEREVSLYSADRGITWQAE